MARILVIDDDPEWHQLMSLVLRREGYDVHYAFNGKEGYDKILYLQPDLVMLDMVMPGLNGMEVAKRVTANTAIRDIPIIVMTARGDDPRQLEQSIKAHGVREYVRKPPDIGGLTGLVRRILASYPRRAPPPMQIAKGVIRFDLKFRTVWISDRLVATLSPNKAKLFKALMDASGTVRREKLMLCVWGRDGHRAVLDKTIQRLREDLGAHAERIQTGMDGYELIG